MPPNINYQGYIDDVAGVPVDATLTVTFRIYSSETGGAVLWSETENVVISGGKFSNILGDTTVIPVDLFDGTPLFLGIEVESDGEMNPRKPLSTAPYAFTADNADLLDGQHASEIIDAASDEVRMPISQSDIPLTITTSGSYYFSENILHDIANTDAIRVETSDVTIDMMGFTLKGTSSSNSGIEIVDQNNVKIFNGTIREFGVAGIRESFSTGGPHTVTDVSVIDNDTFGIELSGDGHQVLGCRADSNQESGIFINNGLVSNNSAQNNIDFGIYCAGACMISNNTARRNSGGGIYAGSASNVINNATFFDAVWGIYAAGINLIEGNNIINGGISATAGLRVGFASRVVGNNVRGGSFVTDGILVDSSGSIIVSNHISNFDVGISFDAVDNAYRGNTSYNNSIAYGGSESGNTTDLGSNAEF